MKQKNKNIWSKVLFLALVAMLLLPAFQAVFKPVEEKPLHGAIAKAERPSFSLHAWFDESLQRDAEAWINQHFGFRNSLVRLYNQTRFWLYNKASARGVIVGKDDYLYEENYIKAYYGRDYIGDSLIRKRVERLVYLQDTLQQMGKTMVVCLAPGKGQFYPDYIPDYLRGEKSRTNYQQLKADANQLGLNYIDFNAWFLKLKKDSPYPLYPKTGIHWSHYGSDLFIDSLLHYIEVKRHVDIPDFVVKKRYLSEDYQTPDIDIEQGMNLMFPLKKFPMPYSEYSFEGQNKSRLKIMVISDSFFWQIFSMGIMAKVFDDGEFWYYDRQIFQPSKPKPTMVDYVDIRKKLLDTDVVVLLSTDANLNNFPWKFDEKAYDALQETDSAVIAKEKEIRGIMNAIKGNDEWLASVREKARKRNIPVDSMVRLDAEYMYRQKMKQANQ